jgi:putative Ca2+/H+ antiporter (TMEM165/GDT1 family)
MAELLQDSGAIMALFMLTSFVAAGVKLWHDSRDEKEKQEHDEKRT